MAGNAEVIREFLVALGFKVDQKGLKTFKEGVEDSTKGVVRLVATIQGAALTIGASVAGFASKIESLYFVGRRVGATENSLRALGGAARDFGVSADVALGSVEAIAKFMRNNPAGESYIASLGVQTRDANGNLRDTVDLVADIGRVMAAKPTWLASQYSSVLGIDENLMLAMRDPAFVERLQQIRKESENNGMSRAAKDAHELMNSIRELGRTADNMFTLIQADLQEKVGPELKRFSAWFKDNAPEIAKRISDVAQVVLRMAETILPVLGAVIEKFVEWDKATNGWTTNILLAVAALKALGGFQILSGLGKLSAALRGVGGAAAAAQAGAAAGGAAAAGAGVAAGATIGTTALAAAAIGAPIAIGGAYLQHQMTGTEEGINQRIADRQARIDERTKFIELERQGMTDEEVQKSPPTLRRIQRYQDERAQLEKERDAYVKKLEQLKAAPPAARVAPPVAAPEAAPATAAGLPDAMEFFQKLGWTQEQAAGIVANLKHESNMRADAVGDQGQAYGIAQWHPDRQANFAQWAGKDIRQSTLAEQLAFVHHELTQGAERRAGQLLRASQNAQQAGEVVSRYYERPRDADGEALRRGQTAVSMSASTTIYVSGARDPMAVAEAVASEQGRVNDAAVRTIGGAQG